MEGFTYATSLDLNMGYYQIKLNPTAQKICTIIFPWGKYKYKRLIMGIKIAPDVFQQVGLMLHDSQIVASAYYFVFELDVKVIGICKHTDLLKYRLSLERI